MTRWSPSQQLVAGERVEVGVEAGEGQPAVGQHVVVVGHQGGLVQRLRRVAVAVERRARAGERPQLGDAIGLPGQQLGAVEPVVGGEAARGAQAAADIGQPRAAGDGGGAHRRAPSKRACEARPKRAGARAGSSSASRL